MKKHMVTVSIVALFGLAPLAAMAQDHAMPAESPHAVKKLESPSTGNVQQGRSVSTGTTGPAMQATGKATPRTDISTPKGTSDETEISR